MEILGLLWDGFGVAMTPVNVMYATIGAVLGLVLGAMPGIGSMAGVALLLPLTFKLDPTSSIIMLAAIYYSNMYGGSFSAILLNIPGDAPAVMTAVDGYKLTRKGKAGKALYTSIFTSFIGGTIGIIILTFIGPLLAQVGLRFGPAEMAAIIILAFTSIGWVLGDDPLKGLMTTAFGLMLASIGVDLNSGGSRFSFGIPELMSGIDFVPLVIGMFGFSQVMILIQDSGAPGSGGPELALVDTEKLTIKNSLLTWKEYKQVMPCTVRTGFLGMFIGILPGAGATIAAFLCYIIEKRICWNGKDFGTGVLEGVAAPESSNNSAAVGSFAPMLSLGIPGGGTTAVLLGGLMMWGLNPGPLLFTERPDFCWGLIASMYTGNFLCVVIATLLIPLMIHILRVPVRILVPIISVICVVGSYSVNNSMFDVGVMIVAGLIGYIFEKYNYPTAPLLLAFVLSPMLERSSRAAFDISGGSLDIFFNSSIAMGAFVGIILICTVPVITRKIKARIRRKADEAL